MVTLKLTGILTDIFPVETISNTFSKRVFWLKEPDTERYPQHWELELHNEDCARLKGFATADRVEVEVELRGRLYEKGSRKGIFNSLKCVGLQRQTPAGPSPFKK